MSQHHEELLCWGLPCTIQRTSIGKHFFQINTCISFQCGEGQSVEFGEEVLLGEGVLALVLESCRETSEDCCLHCFRRVRRHVISSSDLFMSSKSRCCSRNWSFCPMSRRHPNMYSFCNLQKRAGA